jgi:hypothetical protein
MDYKKIVFIFLLSLCLPLASIQPVNATGGLTEQIGLITDRSFYCVGETLFFKAEVLKNSKPALEEWSNVLYLELVTPDGKVMLADKFSITDGASAGSMVIPTQLLSGNYYLRAYTKWMRNQSTNGFSFLLLKIINPFSVELLTNGDIEDHSVPLIPIKKKVGKYLSIQLDTDSLKTGQSLELALKSNPDSLKKISCTVAIVRKGSSNNLYFQLPVDSAVYSPVTYLPETRGVTLSGQVVNKADSTAIPFAKVWLTAKGATAYTREAMAGADGRFYFDLGKSLGLQVVYLHAATNKTAVTPLVLVDSDFATITHRLPFVPFEIHDAENELAQQLIIEAQLDRFFSAVPSQKANTAKADSAFFYGKPDQVIRFEQYIDMPTVRDYLTELLPNIKVEYVNKVPVFQFVAENFDLLSDGPLVMLNLKKVENANTILGLSPSAIDRVEIIWQPYIRGEITYTGIIHFLTKRPDLQEIKYPEGSLFLDYQSLSNTPIVRSPKTDQALPNLGNCIFWNPSLCLSASNPVADIKIESPSEPGEFEIIVEYFDDDFSLCRTSKSFVIY